MKDTSLLANAKMLYRQQHLCCCKAIKKASYFYEALC